MSILDSIGQHGLAPSSIDYELDRRPVRIDLHGITDYALELCDRSWRLVDGTGQTVGPSTIWEHAQHLRAQAKLLDQLLGVLEDLGQRVIEDDA